MDRSPGRHSASAQVYPARPGSARQNQSVQKCPWHCRHPWKIRICVALDKIFNVADHADLLHSYIMIENGGEALHFFIIGQSSEADKRTPKIIRSDLFPLRISKMLNLYDIAFELTMPYSVS